MSIQSEITRISGNVSDALSAIEAKGVTIPSGASSDDLADLIELITGGNANISQDSSGYIVIGATTPDGEPSSLSDRSVTVESDTETITLSDLIGTTATHFLMKPIGDIDTGKVSGYRTILFMYADFTNERSNNFSIASNASGGGGIYYDWDTTTGKHFTFNRETGVLTILTPAQNQGGKLSSSVTYEWFAFRDFTNNTFTVSEATGTVIISELVGTTFDHFMIKPVRTPGAGIVSGVRSFEFVYIDFSSNSNYTNSIWFVHNDSTLTQSDFTATTTGTNNRFSFNRTTGMFTIADITANMSGGFQPNVTYEWFAW